MTGTSSNSLKREQTLATIVLILALISVVVGAVIMSKVSLLIGGLLSVVGIFVAVEMAAALHSISLKRDLMRRVRDDS